ncbi:MAG: nitronate monooxygenase [Lentisphaerae bacterium]|nr:nitronate monooxygenase [Lentisphaerota bacterium]
MNTPTPVIIQGGMGAGVSSWTLAGAVSRLGQLGVVSGTGLAHVLVRRLQDGDPGGHVRRALENLPFPAMVQRIVSDYFIPEGRAPDAPYPRPRMDVVEGDRESEALSIASNFVEVFLAREGHNNPVGINYLEKIQFPHLPSLYGAMLAGVAVVIMGAGIPIEIPGVMDALAQHDPTSYPVFVHGAEAGDSLRMRFDPAAFAEPETPTAALPRPAFFPIVSSGVLAKTLFRRSTGSIEGLIVEGCTAGGHNAPPRGTAQYDALGQPMYGDRDVVNLQQIRDLGLPFWLAGGYGSPERLQVALSEGATGVQVGTAFALCEESGLVPSIRQTLVTRARKGEVKVFTDPVASPTGFPFKVAELEGSLSDPEVYAARRRICDIGLLRELYRKEDHTIGYRCPAEPEAAYVAKGGALEATVGRQCLCNALISNVGMPQIRPDGRSELALVTLGDDVAGIGRFCSGSSPNYSAADVLRVLLQSA